MVNDVDIDGDGQRVCFCQDAWQLVLVALGRQAAWRPGAFHDVHRRVVFWVSRRPVLCHARGLSASFQDMQDTLATLGIFGKSCVRHSTHDTFLWPIRVGQQ